MIAKESATTTSPSTKVGTYFTGFSFSYSEFEITWHKFTQLIQKKKGKEWRSILPELPKFAPFLLLMPQLL